MEYFLLGLEFFVTLWLLCGACTSRYLQRPEEGSDSLGLELKMVLDISFCHHGTDILLTVVPSALKRGPRYSRHPTNT